VPLAELEPEGRVPLGVAGGRQAEHDDESEQDDEDLFHNLLPSFFY